MQHHHSAIPPKGSEVQARDRHGPGHHHQVHAQHIDVVAQVRDVYGDVHLAGRNAGAPPVPRQLPSPPAHFTNRSTELNWLAHLHQQALGSQRRELAVIGGPGGVGKTVVATHFLTSMADAFPDGQLYADLRGFSSENPADPGEVAAGFLRSLGVGPEAIPADLAARTALLRSYTHGKRVAMLLDNAHSAAQVRCLLPGDGAHLVLVTTRLHLAGLVTEGAAFLDLAPLGPTTATALLARLLHDTTHATDTALAELAHLCAGLPLALTVAAAPLLLHPHTSLPATIQRLRTQRLHALSTADPEGVSVTATLDTSYAALSEPAARLYRHAGQHPGAFDAPTAAALANLGQHETDEALTELLTAHLIEAPAPDRYRLHDLNRDHAQATSHRLDSEPEREQAIERMLEYYLTTAAAADLLLNPHRFRLALAVFETAKAAPFDTRETALTWMETELATLAELVRLAHEAGRHATCWRLCESLRTTLMLTKHYDTWQTCCALGLASAQELDDPEAEAFMRFLVASHLLQAECDTEAAMGHYREALRLWRSVGHRQGQASAFESIGATALARGEHDQALNAITRSLDIHLELGRDRGVAIQHRYLGDIHRSTGNHPRALAHYDQALQYFRSIHDDYMTVRALVGLAESQLQRDETDQAQASAEEALTLAERVSARHEIANALLILADIAHHRGETNEQDYVHRAHELFTQLASPNMAASQARLDELANRTE